MIITSGTAPIFLSQERFPEPVAVRISWVLATVREHPKKKNAGTLIDFSAHNGCTVHLVTTIAPSSIAKESLTGENVYAGPVSMVVLETRYSKRERA